MPGNGLNLSVLTLLLVFFLIAVRRIARLRLRMWQAMSFGAGVVLISGQISFGAALQAIDWDVIGFLFGMFVMGQALVASGDLHALADRLLGSLRSTDGLVLCWLVGSGAAAAVLMNDTLAVIATPLALTLAKAHRLNPKLLLLSLAFAVTLGSAMSPIGNPQNLLIAVHGNVKDPFGLFFQALGIPTLMNLAFTYLWIRWRFHGEFRRLTPPYRSLPLADPALARRVRWAAGVILALIGIRSLCVALGLGFDFRLSYVALAGAVPLLSSVQRGRLLRSLDWGTLVFFIAMFVLMASVWQSGFFQTVLARWHAEVGSPTFTLMTGVVLSQFISNVPMVALYLPLLAPGQAHVASLMALAAGSTVAGNLLVMGAASNVIIIQNAEYQGVNITFLEFARMGIPLTVVHVAVYWTYLHWLYGQ